MLYLAQKSTRSKRSIPSFPCLSFAFSKRLNENALRETFNMVAPDLGTGVTLACAVITHEIEAGCRKWKDGGRSNEAPPAEICPN